MAIYMPGVSNNMDINGIIKKMMDAKSEPLKRIDRDIDNFNLEKEIWQTVRKRLDDLGDKAKRLYDHTNPFREMLAESSDKDSFTATANRKAQRGQRRIQVLQLATPHTILSDSLPKDKRFSRSVFTIKMDNKEVRIDFSDGGTLKELADLLEKQLKDMARVVFTFDTADTGILMIEGAKTGSGYGFHFGGELKTLLETGILKPGTDSALAIPFKSKSEFEKYMGLPPGQELFRLEQGTLLLPGGSRIERVLPRTLRKGEGWTLEIEVKVDPVALAGRGTGTGGKTTPSYDPANLQIGPDSSVSVDGIVIFGSRLLPTEKDFQQSSTNRPPETNAPPPGDGKPAYNILSLVDMTGGVRKEFRISMPEGLGVWKKVTVALDQVAGLAELSRLAFINDGVNHQVACRNLRLLAPSDGKFVPKNELTRPGDAVLKLDGIRITRKNNKIDDLIDGVTLTLRKPGNEGTLDIDHDKKIIQKYIFEFLETYNNTIQYLNAITKYMTKDEKDKLEKENKAKSDFIKALEDKDKAAIQLHAGKLSGDMQIWRLKNAMREILTSPYQTRLGKALILLSQMGISTGAPGSTWADLKKNMGAVELDTNKLTDMIEKDIIAVAQIFGYDTSGDGRHDSGAAWRLYGLTRQYIQPGNSVVTIKLQTIDRSIKDKQRTKEQFERSLKNYEERLRRQWADSETKQKQYRNQMRWLNNQNQNRGQDQ